MNLFDHIPLTDRRGKRTVHDNVNAYLSADRGQPRSELTHETTGTVNHRQGYHAAALRMVRLAVEGQSPFPGHAEALPAVIDATRAMLREEAIYGQCLGEVLSTNYWPMSAMFRALALHEVILLLGPQPGSAALDGLAGDLVAWVRWHRTLLRLFRTASGLIIHPGIRCKHDPRVMEYPGLLSHCWESPVTDPVIRAEIQATAAGGERLEYRAHEAMAMALYQSPAGRRMEELTREPLAGRLQWEIGIQRSPDGSLRARMPRVRVVHESRAMLPQVVWEVASDARGHVTEWLQETDRQARPGDVIQHVDPERRRIPPTWTVIGPLGQIPDVPDLDLPQTEPPDPDAPKVGINPGSLTDADFAALSAPDRRAALQAIFAVAELPEAPSRIVRVRDRLQRSIVASRAGKG